MADKPFASNFGQRLSELHRKATPTPWYGGAVTRGLTKYGTPMPPTDENLILFLRNNAEAIVALSRAAEDVMRETRSEAPMRSGWAARSKAFSDLHGALEVLNVRS